MQPQPSQNGPRGRRQRLIDPRWQLGVTGRLAGAALLVGLVYLVAVALFVTPERLAEMDGKRVALYALALNALFFVTLSVALALISVRLTHRIAGPAYVLKNAVRGLRNGEYDRRTTLRDSDYLKPLAQEVHDLAMDLRRAKDDQVRAEEALRALLDSGDVDGARRVVEARLNARMALGAGRRSSLETAA